MKLFLVRHGEILSNINKVYAGKSPEELTVNGLRQAEVVAEKLRHYDVYAIYSSPVKRAIQTAKIISERIGINFQIENSFREIEMGPWEGLSENNITERYSEEWQIWHNRPAELILPGRETLQELLERVLKGIEKVYRISCDNNVVVVSHVAIIRVLLLWYTRKSLNLYKTIQIPNAEVFELELDESPLAHQFNDNIRQTI